MEGWVKAHRSLLEHWLWQEKPFSRGQAWIDMLLLANHSGNKALIGNDLVYVERGSFITSDLKLSGRWGWSKTKVRDFLKLLEKDGMIIKNSDRKKTTIIVVNYDNFQDMKTSKEPQEYHVETTERPQKNTNKNVKNDKNEKKVNNTVRFTPPDIDMVRDYCIERNNSVDPQAFIDFYSAKGWMIGKNKMKDWKAAVRTWERNNKKAGASRASGTDRVSEVDNW